MLFVLSRVDHGNSISTGPAKHLEEQQEKVFPNLMETVSSALFYSFVCSHTFLEWFISLGIVLLFLLLLLSKEVLSFMFKYFLLRKRMSNKYKYTGASTASTSCQLGKYITNGAGG